MATFKITVVYLVDGVDRRTVITDQLAKISADDLEYISEYSHLGKPIDNAFAESFTGPCRTECLDRPWFAQLAEV